MDILVTPVVTILTGVGLSAWWAPVIGPPHPFSRKDSTAKPTILAQHPATAAPPASPVRPKAAQIAAEEMGRVKVWGPAVWLGRSACGQAGSPPVNGPLPTGRRLLSRELWTGWGNQIIGQALEALAGEKLRREEAAARHDYRVR